MPWRTFFVVHETSPPHRLLLASRSRLAVLWLRASALLSPAPVVINAGVLCHDSEWLSKCESHSVSIWETMASMETLEVVAVVSLRVSPRPLCLFSGRLVAGPIRIHSRADAGITSEKKEFFPEKKK